MKYPLPVGSVCGTTKETVSTPFLFWKTFQFKMLQIFYFKNYAGICEIGLICADGLCVVDGEETCVAAGADCITGQTCCDSRTCTSFGPTSYCL